MKISTRGRYALRVMVDIAENGGADFVPLKDIAARQEISQKYLESITADLAKAGLLNGRHGKGGGYRLTRDPSLYTVGEVLCVTEGDLAPVACLDANAAPCSRAYGCRTLHVWKDLYALINKYLNGVKLSDIVSATAGGDDYVI